jgi:hypothetical protein
VKRVNFLLHVNIYLVCVQAFDFCVVSTVNSPFSKCLCRVLHRIRLFEDALF